MQTTSETLLHRERCLWTSMLRKKIEAPLSLCRRIFIIGKPRGVRKETNSVIQTYARLGWQKLNSRLMCEGLIFTLVGLTLPCFSSIVSSCDKRISTTTRVHEHHSSVPGGAESRCYSIVPLSGSGIVFDRGMTKTKW